ncbi:hypothetical protein EYF80_001031 [Liparis tanakae]|uniref:Uncharacterized protein n=1 Tax=Liparis tanakae TaxID=230148 RepID=A0A4Z2JEL3_9TELE|nr:hypothetical protein EYF80_001031 [Liparis tanakae]
MTTPLQNRFEEAATRSVAFHGRPSQSLTSGEYDDRVSPHGITQQLKSTLDRPLPASERADGYDHEEGVRTWRAHGHPGGHVVVHQAGVSGRVVDPPFRAIDDDNWMPILKSTLSPNTHFHVSACIKHLAAEDGVSRQTLFQPVVAQEDNPQLLKTAFVPWQQIRYVNSGQRAFNTGRDPLAYCSSQR